MVGLEALVAKGAIAVAGPLIWSYEMLGPNRVILRTGFPVKKGARAKPSYAIRKEPKWTCLSAEHRGSVDALFPAWQELYAEAKKRELTVSKESREIYHKMFGLTHPDNATELQLRLEKAPKPKAKQRIAKTAAKKAASPTSSPDSTWSVYLARAGNGALYTGIAKDVAKRIATHNQGKGSKSLRALGLPVKVTYQEKVGGYGAALKREHQIKKLTKMAKEELAKKKDGAAGWSDLAPGW